MSEVFRLTARIIVKTILLIAIIIGLFLLLF